MNDEVKIEDPSIITFVDISNYENQGFLDEITRDIVSHPISSPVLVALFITFKLYGYYRLSHYSPNNIFTTDSPIPTIRFHVKLIDRFTRDTCIL